MNTADKPKRISQSTILSMGWTKSMIDKLLPDPELVPNPNYRSGPKMRLWYEADVLAAMDTDEYREAAAKSAKRRQASQKAVETKRANAEAELAEIAKTIRVRRVPMSQLRGDTLAAKQMWYDFNARDEYRDAYSADDATVRRWMVNYIRHDLTDYDADLYSIKGKVGREELYHKLKATVLRKIAIVYPELADECDYHNGVTIYD